MLFTFQLLSASKNLIVNLLAFVGWAGETPPFLIMNKYKILNKRAEYAGNVYSLSFETIPTELDILKAVQSIDDRVNYFGYRIIGRHDHLVDVKIHTS